MDLVKNSVLNRSQKDKAIGSEILSALLSYKKKAQHFGEEASSVIAKIDEGKFDY